MKMSKEKHDHKITKNIKAILFAFLMFLPVLSVISTSLYTIFNDNAYQSYDGKETYLQAELKTPTNVINAKNDIKAGNYYRLTITENNRWAELFEDTTQTTQNTIEILNITTLGKTFNYNGNYLKEIYYASMTYEESGNYTFVNMYMENIEGFSAEIKSDSDIEFLIKVKHPTQIKAWPLLSELTQEQIQYTAIQKERYTLNNAFDKAFNELENNKMFSWTKDTIIYDGVYNTLNLLQVKNNTLVVLISYWLYLTTIYIIIDIIIESIVFLTHIINVKADKD